MDLLTPSNPLYDAMEDPEDLNEAVVDIFERFMVTVARRYKKSGKDGPIICQGNRPDVAVFDTTIGRVFLNRLFLQVSVPGLEFLCHFAAELVQWGVRGGVIPGTVWTLRESCKSMMYLDVWGQP